MLGSSRVGIQGQWPKSVKGTRMCTGDHHRATSFSLSHPWVHLDLKTAPQIGLGLKKDVCYPSGERLGLLGWTAQIWFLALSFRMRSPSFLILGYPGYNMRTIRVPIPLKLWEIQELFLIKSLFIVPARHMHSTYSVSSTTIFSLRKLELCSFTYYLSDIY